MTNNSSIFDDIQNSRSLAQRQQKQLRLVRSIEQFQQAQIDSRLLLNISSRQYLQQTRRQSVQLAKRSQSQQLWAKNSYSELLNEQLFVKEYKVVNKLDKDAKLDAKSFDAPMSHRIYLSDGKKPQTCVIAKNILDKKVLKQLVLGQKQGKK